MLLVRALMEQQRCGEALAELGALEELCARWSMPGLRLQEGALIAGLGSSGGGLGGVGGVGGVSRLSGGAALTLAAAPPAGVIHTLAATPGPPAAAGTGAATLPEPLTDRERDVLRLMAAGATNREIAAALIIGDETAKTHVARILRKLDAPTRGAAAAKARQLGLI